MGIVVGDVNNDGYDEIICSGNNRTVAIKGTGQLRWEDQLLWNVMTPGVANTTQPQMADMDNDGALEVVVPILGPPAGFHILDLYEDVMPAFLLSKYHPIFLATRSLKPR